MRREYIGRGKAAERGPFYELLVKIALKRLGFKENKDFIHQVGYCKLSLIPGLENIHLFHVPDFFLFRKDGKIVELFITNQRTYENSGDVFKETVGELLESKTKIKDIICSLFIFGKRCGWVKWLHEGFSLLFDAVFYPEYEAFNIPSPTYTWTGVRSCKGHIQIGLAFTIYSILKIFSKNSEVSLNEIIRKLKEKRPEIFVLPALELLSKERILSKNDKNNKYILNDLKIRRIFQKFENDDEKIISELCNVVPYFTRILDAIMNDIKILQKTETKEVVSTLWEMERKRLERLYRKEYYKKIPRSSKVSLHILLPLLTLDEKELELLSKHKRIPQNNSLFNKLKILNLIDNNGHLKFELSPNEMHVLKHLLNSINVNEWESLSRLRKFKEELKKVEKCFEQVGNPPILERVKRELFKCSRNVVYLGFEDSDNWMLKILLEACDLAQTDCATLAVEKARKDGIKLNLTEAGLVSSPLTKKASYYIAKVVCEKITKKVDIEKVKEKYMDRLLHEASKEIRIIRILLEGALRMLITKLNKDGVTAQLFVNYPLETFFSPFVGKKVSIRQLFVIKINEKEIILNSRHARKDTVQHRGAEEVGKRFALSYTFLKNKRIFKRRPRYFVFLPDGFWREVDFIRLIEGGYDMVFQIRSLEDVTLLIKELERFIKSIVRRNGKVYHK